MAPLACNSRTSRAPLILLIGAMFLGWCSITFVASPPRAGTMTSSKIARGEAAFDRADELLDLDLAVAERLDVQCADAIDACVESGCSMKALVQLDRKLSSSELMLADAVIQAERFRLGEERISYLSGVLQRVGDLRKQMQTMQGILAQVLYSPDLAAPLVNAAAETMGVPQSAGSEKALA